MNINAHLLALALSLRSLWAAPLASATHWASERRPGVAASVGRRWTACFFCLSHDNSLTVLTEQLACDWIRHFAHVVFVYGATFFFPRTADEKRAIISTRWRGLRTHRRSKAWCFASHCNSAGWIWVKAAGYWFSRTALTKFDLYSNASEFSLDKRIRCNQAEEIDLLLVNSFRHIVLRLWLYWPNSSSQHHPNCSSLHSIICGKFLKCLVINSNHYECALCTRFDWNMHFICIITAL